jgi:hypothetical protein
MQPPIHRLLRGVTFDSGESISKLFMELILLRRQHFYNSAKEVILIDDCLFLLGQNSQSKNIATGWKNPFLFQNNAQLKREQANSHFHVYSRSKL